MKNRFLFGMAQIIQRTATVLVNGISYVVSSKLFDANLLWNTHRFPQGTTMWETVIYPEDIHLEDVPEEIRSFCERDYEESEAQQSFKKALELLEKV